MDYRHASAEHHTPFSTAAMSQYNAARALVQMGSAKFRAWFIAVNSW
jgi:hypothetical protein